jgi:hypothetical protein
MFKNERNSAIVKFMQKLQTVLGLIFILTAAGAISVSAQTVSDSSSAAVATNATSINEPKKAELAKPPVPTSETTTSGKTSTIIGDGDKSKASTVAPKESSPETVPGSAKPATDDDKWHFVFSPYFWMAGLHGTIGGPNRTIAVDERFTEIFHSLKFAFMGVFEAHKGKWAMQTDVEFVSIGDDKATPGPLFSSADATIKTFVFTPEVGYKIYNDPDKGNFVQVLGGTRIWHISSDVTFNAGILPATQVNASRSWVDGVVGLRGKAALSEKVFFMGRFDVGGGGSKFTYQLFGGLGYNINQKIAIVGGYRALDVNYDKNNFLYDTSQRGPIMGIGFKF